MKKDPETRRKAILDSALEILYFEGLEKFTLDRIAEKAGVSKGGLLHHFRTKDELIREVIKYLFDEFEKQVEEEFQRTEGKAKWIKAYTKVSMKEEYPKGIAEAFLYALSDVPGVMDIVNEDTRKWLNRFASEEVNLARAIIIKMAVDGFISESAYSEEVMRFKEEFFKEIYQLIESWL